MTVRKLIPLDKESQLARGVEQRVHHWRQSPNLHKASNKEFMAVQNELLTYTNMPANTLSSKYQEFPFTQYIETKIMM
ncbi:hypothetical protein F8M41_022199 [Gigaspora margarita]|uniref:Uncharacterized protein n=1 Tax=Gigaspora margarita TaxID=4874 RepID=A0A8H4AFG3_GIGMA|nr:hypothetical protein F8M41_022199 [Gigaspora margarita]